jgi:hypothetical protein
MLSLSESFSSASPFCLFCEVFFVFSGISPDYNRTLIEFEAFMHPFCFPSAFHHDDSSGFIDDLHTDCVLIVAVIAPASH